MQNFPFFMQNILESLYQPVKKEMDSYIRVFESYLTTDNPLLDQILTTMSKNQGKGMRPLLTILSSKLFGAVPEIAYHLAAAVELFHNATLIHDDIIDESDLRRGKPSIYSLFGSKVSVLAGDYVLTKALISTISTDRLDLMKEIFKTSSYLVDGELLQLYNIGIDDISVQNYFDIIKKKTAVLFATCAKTGAMTNTDNKQDIANMEMFGNIVGKCFQIKDDVFDYIGGDEIGKPRGNDMLEGKLTLPVIHVLLENNDHDMITLANKVKEGRASDEEIATLIQYTVDSGGIDYAFHVMDQYALQARDILAQYPDTEVKESLNAYIDYVVFRNK